METPISGVSFSSRDLMQDGFFHAGSSDLYEATGLNMPNSITYHLAGR